MTYCYTVAIIQYNVFYMLLLYLNLSQHSVPHCANLNLYDLCIHIYNSANNNNNIDLKSSQYSPDSVPV